MFRDLYFSQFKLLRIGGRQNLSNEKYKETLQDEQKGQEDYIGVTIDEIEDWMKDNACKGCIDNHPSQKYHITNSNNKWGCI
jgi:hypothetical protein